MSSLFKRSNGTYYVSFYDPARTPPQKKVSTRLKVKREAEAVQAKLDAGVAKGEFDPFTMDARAFLRGLLPAPGGLDLSVLGLAADAFLRSRSNLQPMTRERYRSIIERFAAHAGRDSPTKSVTAHHVQAFLDSTRTKPVTVHNYRRAISTLFRWLEEQGAREGDPTKGVRLPRVPRKHPRFLTPDDVEAICAAIVASENKPKVQPGTGAWLVPVVRANVYLGLRAGEVVNLRWDDVDLGGRVLTVRQSDSFTTKGGKDRTLPVSDPVLAVLSSLGRRAEWVFPSFTGRQLSRLYLSRRFKDFVRLAGLPEHVCFHTTRHTAASWLAQRGVSVEAIRLYLGHSSVTVTQRYMHLAPDALASQVNAAFREAERGFMAG